MIGLQCPTPRTLTVQLMLNNSGISRVSQSTTIDSYSVSTLAIRLALELLLNFPAAADPYICAAGIQLSSLGHAASQIDCSLRRSGMTACGTTSHAYAKRLQLILIWTARSKSYWRRPMCCHSHWIQQFADLVSLW